MPLTFNQHRGSGRAPGPAGGHGPRAPGSHRTAALRAPWVAAASGSVTALSGNQVSKAPQAPVAAPRVLTAEPGRRPGSAPTGTPTHREPLTREPGTNPGPAARPRTRNSPTGPSAAAPHPPPEGTRPTNPRDPDTAAGLAPARPRAPGAAVRGHPLPPDPAGPFPPARGRLTRESGSRPGRRTALRRGPWR